ncbi:MAG: ceramidase [Rickettsiales bacterium]|nr:ceramidase [Rickettsiales bacterium]
MSLFDPIDNYCERLDASFWAEPLNAVSNAAFLIAALLLFKKYLKQGGNDREALALIGLVKVVGWGSFLFHTFANGLTMMADVIPIAVFVLTYIWVAFRRLLGWRWGSALGAMLVFLCVAPMMNHVPPELAFNGSVAYFPCLAVLVILAAGMKQHPQAKTLWLAAGVFVVSLFLRSVDMHVCDSIASGTHFLWHSFNGVLLYLLVAAILATPRTLNK